MEGLNSVYPSNMQACRRKGDSGHVYIHSLWGIRDSLAILCSYGTLAGKKTFSLSFFLKQQQQQQLQQTPCGNNNLHYHVLLNIYEKRNLDQRHGSGRIIYLLKLDLWVIGMRSMKFILEGSKCLQSR